MPDDLDPSPRDDGPGDSIGFTAARSLKRELLEELRDGWQRGDPPPVEDLVRRWPGGGAADTDAASLLFEDYCQRQARADASLPADPAEYERHFPGLKESLRQLVREHDCLTSLGVGGGPGSGTSGLHLALPAPGDELFDFRLRRELGRGAFARVFLAEQAALAGRPVVLKVSAIEGDEPQTLAQMQHTHIVPIYSIHEDARAGLRAVCMPYFGGASLSAVLKTLWAESPTPTAGTQLARALAQVQGPQAGEAPASPQAAAPFASLSYVRAVVWVVARLAEALQHAHERGVLHRDVKPSNVLLAADGQPMLLDFNLSQSLAAAGAQAAATLGGTVAYMAPEHLRALAARDPALARQVDRRADIYSLGMVLFEMLAGRSPFDQSASYFPLPALIEAMAVERARAWPSLRRHRPDVPWGLESVARLCLAPDPARRYQKAGHLAEDLHRLLEDRPLRHAPELSWRERAGKWARRHPRLTASSVVAAAAALLLVTGANVLLGTRARLTAAQARAFEAEGAEAREQKKLFDEGHQRALCLVNTTTDTPDYLCRGLAECERTLALYGVLDRDDWQAQPLWQRLPAQDQARLAEEARDLLVLLARARTAVARAEAGPAQAGEAGAALGAPAPPAGCGALAAVAVLLRTRPTAEAPLRDALALLDRAEAVPGLGPSASLWEDRASYRDQVGDAAGAREARERARALPPRDVRDYYWRATTLAFAGKYEEAAGALDRALTLNPRHYWSYLQRGLCYSALRRHELALADFSACVALWPEFPWGWFNRGRARDQLGARAEAVADYGEAVRLDPAFVAAYLNRGLTHLQLRRHAEALADFDRAAGLGQDGAALHAGRGLALEGLGRSKEADRAFARAQALDPNNAQMLLAYAFAVHERLPARAHAAFTQVLDREPRNTQALYGLGMLAARTDRRSPEAVALFGRALKIAPGFVEARRGRANVLAHRGDWKAHEDIALCLAADPGGVTLYAGACVYALLAERSGDARRVRWCQEQALRLLGLALERGYGADRAADDEDLATLHGLPAFERLAARKKLQ
jgi:serine/threonine protein kinase/lipoprotein NlpI